jgi:hypothetical protein
MGLTTGPVTLVTVCTFGKGWTSIKMTHECHLVLFEFSSIQSTIGGEGSRAERMEVVPSSYSECLGDQLHHIDKRSGDTSHINYVR